MLGIFLIFIFPVKLGFWEMKPLSEVLIRGDPETQTRLVRHRGPGSFLSMVLTPISVMFERT